MPVPSYQDKTCGCGAVMPAGGPEWARGSCDACAAKAAEPRDWSHPEGRCTSWKVGLACSVCDATPCTHPKTIEGARYEFCLDCGAARLLSAKYWEPYTWTEARS